MLFPIFLVLFAIFAALSLGFLDKPAAMLRDYFTRKGG